MLGQRHRLLCADARRDGSFTRLLTGQGAELVVSDPPYNLSVARIGGRGAIRHAEFVMASGEMSETAFTGFLSTTLGHLVRHSVVGSLHFIFLDWRHIFELLSAARKLYAEFKNLCVWNKSNGGMGSLYRSKHELVFVFKNGTAPHINNVELGRFGRNRTNVWDYAGVNSFREGRLEELAAHPSPKPVELVSDLILDASKRNGVVLDCFGGAGTTVIAAEKTGRRGYLMELDSAYVDASIRRFEKLTGMQAIHADTGLTFAQVERHRLDASSSGDRTSQRRHRAIVDDSTHPSTPLGSVSTLQNRPTHPDSAPGPNQKTIRPLKPGFVKGSHRIALREDAKKA